MWKFTAPLLLVSLLAGCSSDSDPSANPGSGGSAGSDSGVGTDAGDAGGCVCAADSVINSGHRGTGSNTSFNPFPENTIESLKQAFSEGAEMSEFDVVHSKDGVLVAIHDDTVNRTTDGAGCVGDLTVAELQALDAAKGTSLEGTGVKIPTLAEVLAAVDGGLNIELKLQDDKNCPASDIPKMAADVVAAIQGDTKSRTVVVSSFNADVLSEVKKIDKTVQAGLLSIRADDFDKATARGLDALNFHSIGANEQAVAAIHAAGIKANVWTVNDETMMSNMIDYGIDMIITDEPDLLAKVKKEHCAKQCPP